MVIGFVYITENPPEELCRLHCVRVVQTLDVLVTLASHPVMVKVDEKASFVFVHVVGQSEIY